VKRSLVAVGILLTAMSAPSALAQEADPINTTTDGMDLALAMAQDSAHVTDAGFEVVSAPHANAVASGPLTSFPLQGASYAVMTSGDARLADGDPELPGHPKIFASVPNGATEPSSDQIRGNTDFDVSILRIDLQVPEGRDCLTFDFRFLSEEYPGFVGDTFNDAFIAELDSSTWTIEPKTQEIIAPDNFAFDEEGNVVSINSTGIGGMAASNAAGTAYEAGVDPANDDGGATQLLRARTPISEGEGSLYLSIFDQGDQAYDSAVFLDHLVIGTAGPGGCEEGVELAPCLPASIEGTEAGNKLPGTAGVDKIRAFGGRDSIDALAGSDEVCGGGAGDYAYGRDGSDWLLGEDGNDRLYGGDHADVLEGGPGNDAFIPGRGVDTVLAEDGEIDCIQKRSGDEVERDSIDLVNPRQGCAPGFWL
jgi:Ca2+-binding RTX toxin-like protein